MRLSRHEWHLLHSLLRGTSYEIGRDAEGRASVSWFLYPGLTSEAKIIAALPRLPQSFLAYAETYAGSRQFLSDLETALSLSEEPA